MIFKYIYEKQNKTLDSTTKLVDCKNLKSKIQPGLEENPTPKNNKDCLRCKN